MSSAFINLLAVSIPLPLINLLAVVFVLGVMILIHEFGHYAVAKLCGVRVEVFSIGFGKRLLGWKRGNTDYRISLLPLGGYVKMTGENPFEAAPDDPDAFMSHPRWQRFLIAIAGPTMNIMLAIGLLTAVYMVHYVHDSFLEQPARIGWVDPDSAAAKAGLKPGDLIVKLDNLNRPIGEDALYKFLLSPGQPLNISVERNGQRIDTRITPDTVGPSRVGDPGLRLAEQVEITGLEEKLPGFKAGLKPGDQILSLDGIPLLSREAIRPFLDANKVQPVQVSILRNGAPMTITVVPAIDPDNPDLGYRIGFRPGSHQLVDKLPFAQALDRSLEQSKKFSLLIVELVQKLAQRKISIKQVDGPIGIAREAGNAVRQTGWTPLLSLMALISLNLGIFNLLPIPILDGGMILLLAIESFMRRDISAHIKERIYQAAFVFLVLFACLVIYNDIAKSVSGINFP